MLNVIKLKLVASVVMYAKCHYKVIKKLDTAIITALKLSICIKIINKMVSFVIKSLKISYIIRFKKSMVWLSCALDFFTHSLQRHFVNQRKSTVFHKFV